MQSFLYLFIDGTIVQMSFNEISHVLHQVLCLRTVCSQNESNVPHPKACGNFTNRTLPICNVIFLLTHMVNILVCSGDFNKHFEHKLIASRDMRVTLKCNKMKKRTFLAA